MFKKYDLVENAKKQKDLLDSLNSLSWFFMDAAWMIKQHHFAFVFSPVVFFSGLLLVLIDQRRPQLCINIAIESWILMNITWMGQEISEVYFPSFLPKIFLILGIVFIVSALMLSKNMVETFSHFRRFRINSLLK